METARRLRRRIARTLTFARFKQIVPSNPADICEFLKPGTRGKRWPALAALRLYSSIATREVNTG